MTYSRPAMTIVVHISCMCRNSGRMVNESSLITTGLVPGKYSVEGFVSMPCRHVGVRRGITPLIFNLGSRWEVFKLHTLAVLPRSPPPSLSKEQR